MLDAGTLGNPRRFNFSDNLVAGTTGFSRTTAAVSGGYAFVSRDNGELLVLRLSDAQQVPPSGFTQHTGTAPVGNQTATSAGGQPAISNR